MEMTEAILLTIATAATPLLIAALGNWLSSVPVCSTSALKA